jgi:hypothetical protein
VDRHPVDRGSVIHPTTRLEQVARQPDDHHCAEDGKADAKPEKSALPSFPGGISQGGEGHAAVAALGFLRRVGLLAIQTSGHGSVLFSSVPDCHVRPLFEIDGHQPISKACRFPMVRRECL